MAKPTYTFVNRLGHPYFRYVLPTPAKSILGLRDIKLSLHGLQAKGINKIASILASVAAVRV